MQPSSDSGQTEPLAALVAVVAVGIGLSLYVGVLDAELPESPDRHLSESAIERVEEAVAPAGVARPSRLDDGQRAGPAGYRTNVTLATDHRRWTVGRSSPQAAETTSTRIGVRTGPSNVRTGTLRVSVWS